MLSDINTDCEATSMALTVSQFSAPGQTKLQMFQFTIHKGQSFCKAVVVVYGPFVFCCVDFLQILLNTKNSLPHFFKKLELN